MNELIFLQISPSELAVGSGQLSREVQPSLHKPSFYINDFFLSSATPWIIPEFFEVLTIEQASAKYFTSNESLPDISWKDVSKDDFQRTFSQIQNLIDQGALEKAVPVVFETGAIYSRPASLLTCLASKLSTATSRNLYLFGFEDGANGIVGLSPEVLFERKEQIIASSALAGTQSSDLNPDTIQNSKDIREHKIVIDDLKEKLSTFGKVSVENTTSHNVGSLIHLRASLSVPDPNNISFDAIVNTLHPTAALGVYPQTESALLFLKDNDIEVKRDLFGSPFGIHFPNGDSLCIVSIRSAQWTETTIRIGSGCGIIKESDFEAEFEELRIKRDSIKSKLIS